MILDGQPGTVRQCEWIAYVEKQIDGWPPWKKATSSYSYDPWGGRGPRRRSETMRGGHMEDHTGPDAQERRDMET